MSSIINELQYSIKNRGFITIDHFMSICLTEKSDSYYRFKNPLGQNGDFITSPEISQMFGEMIGVFLYDFIIKSQKINPNIKNINIVELGPGTGLLMRDLLRSISKTSFFNQLNVFLYEVNDFLVEEQKNNLKNFSKIKWIKQINQLPNDFTIFVANEFFDALPITQYIKIKNHWKEVVLKLDPKDGMIVYDRVPVISELNEYLNFEYPNSKDGAFIEESKETAKYIKNISNHITKHGGGCLIIDYGYDLEPQNRKDTQFYPTLQALMNHKYVPVLSNFGLADLTAHVDFWMIKKISDFNKQINFGSISQRDFLNNLGIKIRLELLKQLSPENSKILDKQYDRLTSKSKMGDLFKVLFFTNSENLIPLSF